MGLPLRTAHWRITEYLARGWLKPMGREKTPTKPAVLYGLTPRGRKALATCQ